MEKELEKALEEGRRWEEEKNAASQQTSRSKSEY